MDSSVFSPVETLNAALQAHNPFEKPAIVKDQEVWGKGFPDVTSLNAHASTAVLHMLEKACEAQSSQEKVISLVITAQPGVGKSHIISRIRHKLQANGGSLFVYASADKYGDLDLIKYSFQQTLANSLKQIGSQGVMQWQEVATMMAHEALKASNPKVNLPSPADLVKKFDIAYVNSLAKGKNLIEDLSKQIRKLRPNADPYIIRAILWTLSENQAPFVIKWLSGEELAQQNAYDLGLPNPRKTSQDREADALTTIGQITSLVGEYSPVLICFDEIDSLNTNKSGYTTPQVIADLVKSLFGSLQQSDSSQGVAILTVMMPDTWSQTIKNLGSGIPDRISTVGEPIDLKHIDSNSMIELVTLWLKDFYDSRSLKPHSPIYPFKESQLQEYGKNRLTVREALKWCAENLKIDIVDIKIDSAERFQKAVDQAFNADFGDYFEDNNLIASALSICFQKLKGQTLEEVSIEGIEEVKPKAKNAGHINFKVVGKQNSSIIKIGVSVLQQTNGLAVGAGFKRIIDYQTFGITRGCLVRSKARKIKRHWDSNVYYQKLLAQGGEWVDLKDEEIKPLLAIKYIYDKKEKYSLSEEQIDAFIAERKFISSSLLIREILSDPSIQIVEDALEDDNLGDLAFQVADSVEEKSMLSEALQDITEDAAEESDMSELLAVGE